MLCKELGEHLCRGKTVLQSGKIIHAVGAVADCMKHLGGIARISEVNAVMDIAPSGRQTEMELLCAADLVDIGIHRIQVALERGL